MLRKIRRSNMSVALCKEKAVRCGAKCSPFDAKVRVVVSKPANSHKKSPIYDDSNEDHVKRLVFHHRKLPIYNDSNEDHVKRLVLHQNR